ncbi:hypothetical protein C8J42_1101 [Sphingomonas sp. PP-CE-1A-559]|nr:hypothetical protein C8J42_1101 [Sphingomonas sp. PP-CE-1A-559]
MYFRRLPIPQTGALAAAESGLRLLTQAAIEKRTFTADVDGLAPIGAN